MLCTDPIIPKKCSLSHHLQHKIWQKEAVAMFLLNNYCIPLAALSALFASSEWIFFKILFIYLWETESEWVRKHQQAEGEGEQAPCWARSPKKDSIPRPWDHDLSHGQTLNRLSHPGAPQRILTAQVSNVIIPIVTGVEIESLIAFL